MDSTWIVVPEEVHNQLVHQAFLSRGYTAEEVDEVVRFCAEAARHGIHTHNAIKAFHLDTLFGSRVGGCVPGAVVEKLKGRFPAAEVWDAHKKMGPPVSFAAIETCVHLAEQYGVGMVSVDNAFHYFWGAAYLLEAARRGYIAYTQCTAMLAEVVPFGGAHPTLGTNPHTWALPTQDIVGYPVLVDFATSAIAMGRVQQLRRENAKLPPHSALDDQGHETDDPARVAALLPFGAHKGYGLGLINEIMAGFIGGSRPTVRGRHQSDGEKHTPCFFFMVMHPEAMSAGRYAQNRDLRQNLAVILEDIRGPGNQEALLPGQIEAQWAEATQRHGGFLFSEAEFEAFQHIATECGAEPWRRAQYPQINL
jgi:ureidoglycolate dehydrogenase (NAD+)